MYQKSFKETSDEAYIVLEDLYEKSCQDYFNYVELESDCFERRRDLVKIHEFTNYLEEYIHSLEKLDYLKDLKKILHKISKLNAISILPKNERNKKIIYDKSTIKLDPTLNEENHRVFIYCELSGHFHKRWLNDISYCIKSINENKKIKRNDQNNYYIEQAFDLLDDVTSKSTAENIKKYINKNQTNENNLNYLNTQEEIILAANYFSYTLDYSKEDSLKQLSKDSFQDDFIRKIVSKSRYSLRGDKDLYNMLVSLGKINEFNKCQGKTSINNNLKGEFLNELLEINDENKKYIKFKK